MSSYPITIGDVRIEGFEAPEKINLGTYRALSVQDFPGGKRTIQDFGMFADETIGFNGILLGGQALARSKSLHLLMKSKEEVSFIYAHWNYQGIVSRWIATPRNQWQVEYQIEFTPRIDNTQTSGGANRASVEDEIKKTVTIISQRLYNPPAPFEFSENTRETFAGFQEDLANALANHKGRVANFPPSVVFNLTKTLRQTQTFNAPWKVSTNYGASSAAFNLDSLLKALISLLEKDNDPVVTIKVVNPNLFELASQYLGDPGLWTYIASRNQLIDPQPKGEFTLVIPLNVKTLLQNGVYFQ